MTKTPLGEIVVKIGGSTLGAHDTTMEDLVALQRQDVLPVVVHGGGPIINQWLDVHGIPSQFVRGLRSTSATGLEVVTAVLAGLVNKSLVAAINALGGKAIGISGIDGRLIDARVLDPELGYVGQATAVDLAPLEALAHAGYIPVISTLGFNPQAEDGPRTLNLNADTVAGELAHAMRANKLIFLTDVPGVLDVDKQVLPHLTPHQTSALIASGAASGGMIPKLEACLRAREAETDCWIVDGRNEHVLLAALSPAPLGTQVW